MDKSIILGIWDGHDSGAALIHGNKILYAANEERFTRRKLEIRFPFKSIQEGLKTVNLTIDDIHEVAFCTTDPAKTLTRLLPSLKERYYQIRRKKVYKKSYTSLIKKFKYFFTELSPNSITATLSKRIIKRNLAKIGIKPTVLTEVDHHTAHAYGAQLTSHFSSSLIVTIDGIGDGLSGTIWNVENDTFSLLHEQSGKHSVGIFYEHVTNLLNMRELEDEGKVMALADFSLPIDYSENPLRNFFRIEEGRIISKYNSVRLYDELKKVLWKYPLEQFAYLAQQELETVILEYIQYWLKRTKKKNVVLSGGVFANIKLNQKILFLPEVKDIFVFPHMGDGGLAFGSAAVVLAKKYKIKKLHFKDCFLGPSIHRENIEKVFKKFSIRYRKIDPGKVGARLISRGKIVLWFHGVMEYGPRALGHRSILALPGKKEIKDTLNLKIKKRVWYQPFCPSMLLSEAERMFKEFKGTENEHMTCGYFVKNEYVKILEAVINVDNSCRPQIVLPHNKVYFDLLTELKKITGNGVVLNTSLNIHGKPIVNTQEEVLDLFMKNDIEYLILDNWLIEKNEKK